MKFSLDSYKDMIGLLKAHGYEICNYHTWNSTKRCAILRHDIDYSVEKSLELAQLEASLGVQSTYFVLLTSDFYNVASAKNLKILQEMHRLGHDIGLHFDEKSYAETTVEDTVERIVREKTILSDILGTPVSCVSMHRPSKATLEANLKIPGMVNSYGEIFFHDFKYLSDSRRHWREPVLDIIRSELYDRLHILTHAFWYQENDESIHTTVKEFLLSALPQRYDQLRDNIKDLESIIQRSEVCGQ